MTCKVVGAFDFGTTYSGYAYSFNDKPIALISQQNWASAPEDVVSMKTATSLLLEPDGKCDSFGYEAEVRYSELIKEGVQDRWRLFRQFKMLLHNNKTISPTTTVSDTNGCPMLAMDVFSMSIGYLREHMLKSLFDILKNNPGVDMKNLDIHYVLTVPAIWDDDARMFMREAASKAGIEPAKLRLVLEPEAASVWGQSVNAEKLALSVEGSQYMVIDIGGGTADISVHEKKADGTLREIHSSTGGPWGGKFVDDNFLRLLDKIFGTSVMEDFKHANIGEYLEMMREFEQRKKVFSSDVNENTSLKIPDALLKKSSQIDDKRVRDRIKECGYEDKVIIENGKVTIDLTVMKTWFDDPLDSLLAHVKELLSQPKLRGVTSILLVGGVAENTYVQAKLRAEVGNVRVIGAVRAGHIPNLVSSKIRRYANKQTAHSLFENIKSEQFTDQS